MRKTALVRKRCHRYPTRACTQHDMQLVARDVSGCEALWSLPFRAGASPVRLVVVFAAVQVPRLYSAVWRRAWIALHTSLDPAKRPDWAGGGLSTCPCRRLHTPTKFLAMARSRRGLAGEPLGADPAWEPRDWPASSESSTTCRGWQSKHGIDVGSFTLPAPHDQWNGAIWNEKFGLADGLYLLNMARSSEMPHMQSRCVRTTIASTGHHAASRMDAIPDTKFRNAEREIMGTLQE
ncbi:hypothetical protein CCHR01_19527 [Colletotrichum chrysophilum]|uniref:Uncharacterized protein n=1 Tax=Colletotrichum chrysophilum TaxID=1836956 RepID=A0AAD8ZY48_9PEZI|nr:hypothetical protein CCHR01_19527 [Colletotrichum chrysophilum]